MAAYAMSMPALTRGGSRPAEIAVPTNALVTGELRETARTMPAAADTRMEMMRLKPWPSGIIALFGHL